MERIKDVLPDVITLDVEMPRMDGITFLQKIMSQHPLPVVMVSSLTENGSETTFKALEYGAVDIIQKPRLGVQQFLEESKIIICDAVKAAARAGVKKTIPMPFHVPPKLTADADRALLRPGQPVPHRPYQLVQYERFRRYSLETVSLYSVGQRCVNTSRVERDQEAGSNASQTDGEDETMRSGSTGSMMVRSNLARL